MFDTINGLPVHPLVVHAVVVLLPLAILGTIALVVRPRWRRPYGLLVLGVTAVATVLIPVATSSGESLEGQVGDPGQHAEIGEQLIWFAIPLLLVVAVLVWLDRRPPASAPQWLAATVSVVAVVLAVATGIQVYRVGDSGARAAWGDEASASSSQ